jgi:signal transduction histidine kinase
VFTVIAQVDVWRPEWAVWGDDAVLGPRPLNSLLLMAVTVPLAWRRTAPMAATSVVMAGVAAQAQLTGQAPVGLLVAGPVLTVVYAVAAYGSRAQAWAGLALSAFAAAVGTVNDPTIRTASDVGDASYWWLVTGAAWLTGMYVRSRRHGLAQAERATRLERERDERAREAVTQERLRIAHELHDVVAHSVSVVALQAGAALEVLDREPERAREPLQAIELTARSTLVEMQALVGILRDMSVEQAPTTQHGLADLDTLAAQVTQAGLPVQLCVDGECPPLTPGLDLSAYRIVQEALTNALKHAGPAARALVMVRYEPRQLTLEILDDGSGSLTSAGQGHGLVGMRERVALYRGEIDTGPQGTGGYAVRVRLPIPVGGS